MDNEIPPSYEDCVVDGLPPPYPKTTGILGRFFSWILSKVSRGNRENQEPPKYMIEIVDINRKVHYIDLDSPWVVMDDDHSDCSDCSY